MYPYCECVTGSTIPEFNFFNYVVHKAHKSKMPKHPVVIIVIISKQVSKLYCHCTDNLI